MNSRVFLKLLLPLHLTIYLLYHTFAFNHYADSMYNIKVMLIAESDCLEYFVSKFLGVVAGNYTGEHVSFIQKFSNYFLFIPSLFL